MDPYLEAHWGDVHTRLVLYVGDALRWVEIIDLDTGGKVVTTIEVLGPANKIRNRKPYQRKQQDFLEGRVNLVEIDLLRQGSPIVLAHDSDERKPVYEASVTRASDPFRREWYPISLQDELPVIPIPLWEEEEEVILPLQPILEQCCAMGRYARRIDYGKSLVPPLCEEEDEWFRARMG